MRVTHGIRLLAAAATALLGAALVTPIGVADAAGDRVEYTSANDSGAKFSVAVSYDLGEEITISGTGYTNSAGTAGSVIAVLVDAAGSGDPNTVYTKRTVTNPASGEQNTNSKFHAITQANNSGAWSVSFPMPTPATGYFGDKPGKPAIEEWQVAQVHSVRLLTGSLLPGDKIRSDAAEFCIEACDSTPGTAPGWAHVTATDGTATAWVQRNVGTSATAKVKVKGAGWGTDPVQVSLNSSDTETYSPDPAATITPTGGNFGTAIDLPDTLTPGDYLSVTLADGGRSVTTETLLIAGSPYTPTEPGTDSCVPSTATAGVRLVNTRASFGGTLTVRGTGWCHPRANSGASRVAVKIDDGAYAHPKGAGVYSDLTVWAIIDPDPATGDFTARITLPDGTARTSTPKLTKGGHTLRFLSGTLKTGDTVRTVETDDFVVGTWRPNGTPEPIEATEGLTTGSRGGMSVRLRGTTLTAKLPRADKGDWVYLNVYDGAAPTFPLGQKWLRASANGTVTATLNAAAKDLPAGRLKVSAQSGNQGEVGKLLGWGWITIPKAPTDDTTDPTGPTPTPTPSTPAPAGIPVGPPAFAPTATAPTHTPALPALTRANAGSVPVALDGSTLSVTGLPAGTFVHLTVVAGDQQVPTGWLLVPGTGTVTVDVGSLPAGSYRIGVQDSTDNLIGWSNFGDPGAMVPTAAGEGAGVGEEEIAPPVLKAFTPASASTPLWRVRTTDAVLIIAGIALLAGTAGGIAVGSRRRAA